MWVKEKRFEVVVMQLRVQWRHGEEGEEEYLLEEVLYCWWCWWCW
jgi:hypothetical protein